VDGGWETTEVAVRLLREDEIDRAASLLARAFDADPPARYMFPDPARRPRLLALQFAAIMRDALVHGAVYTTPDAMQGVAVWLAPGQTDLTDERMARAGFDAALATCDDEERHRCGQFFERIDALHHSTAQEPHWYLFVIGVDPPHQGTGVGTTLMQPVLVQAEREEVPCHLETGQPRNMSFYQERGFRIVGEDQGPGGIVPLWAFQRP
jgi:GNAT superfamily N-acetyltransferase